MQSAGHHIAGNTEKSEGAQKMPSRAIESFWAMVLWEVIKKTSIHLKGNN